MNARLALACLVIAVWPALLAAQSGGTALTPGQPVSFSMPANTVTGALFFDVPAGTRRFRVSLSAAPGAPANADLDLLLRYGQPFPLRNVYGVVPDQLWLLEHAHYQAIAPDATESITVGPSGVWPARAGRWHLAVYNFTNAPVTARVQLEFLTDGTPEQAFTVRFDLPCPSDEEDCVCDLAPWNDPSPGPNAPGNPGTTLGEKRRRAMLEAARLLGQNFVGEAPITIQACWRNAGGGADQVTLASAGPTDFHLEDRSLALRPDADRPFLNLAGAFLSERYAFAPAAIVARQAGTPFCRAVSRDCGDWADIRIYFNDQIDTPNGLGDVGFYYGLQPQITGRDIDFVSVAMHEIIHGLGFVSLVSLGGDGRPPIGSKPLDRDDVYSRRVVSTVSGTAVPFWRGSNADRAAAMTSSSRLQWIGPAALAAPNNRLQFGDVGLRLHAPPDISSGSTLSHLNRGIYGGVEMMGPNYVATRFLSLALPMLEDVGWSPQPRALPVVPGVPTGLWFDPVRSGHGFDLQAAVGPAPYPHLVSIMYTYDAAGEPEFYLSQGPLVDGVYVAANDGSGGIGDSLLRYLYDPARNPPQRPDPASGGQLRIDFNRAEESRACNDPHSRPPNPHTAAMLVLTGTNAVEWCLQLLTDVASRPAPDYSGIWSAANDPGWGFSIANVRRDDGRVLWFVLLYYPDAQGQPRWALASTENFQPGQALPLIHRKAFCRHCPPQPVQDRPAGTLTLSPLGSDPNAGITASFQVTYQGAAGGTFSRQNARITRLSLPPTVVQSGP